MRSLFSFARKFFAGGVKVVQFSPKIVERCGLLGFVTARSGFQEIIADGMSTYDWVVVQQTNE